MKAAIFDLDGTLLDSMGVWAQIDRDFLQKRGLPVPADYTGAVASMSFRETADYTIARFSLPESPEAVMREWYEMAREAYGKRVSLKPFAGEYLRRLKARGLRLATATSLTDDLSVPALRRNGVASLFDATCCTAEVGQGKSSPAVFLRAAEKLGVAPADCLVFEDICAGVLAAKRAGMTVFGVFDPAAAEEEAAIRAAAAGYIRDFRDAPFYNG